MSVTHPFFSKFFSKSCFFAALIGLVASTGTPVHAAEAHKLLAIQNFQNFARLNGVVANEKHVYVYGESFDSRGVVRRYRHDGTLDKSFGEGGSFYLKVPKRGPIEMKSHVLRAHFRGESLVILGTIIGPYGTPPPEDVFIAKLNLNQGAIDTSFGKQGLLRIGNPKDIVRFTDALLRNGGDMIVAISKWKSQEAALVHIDLEGEGNAKEFMAFPATEFRGIVEVPSNTENALSFRFLASYTTTVPPELKFEVSVPKTLLARLSTTLDFNNSALSHTQIAIGTGVFSSPRALRVLPGGELLALLDVFPKIDLMDEETRLRAENSNSAIVLLHPQGSQDLSFGEDGVIFNQNPQEDWRDLQVMDKKVAVLSSGTSRPQLLRLNVRQSRVSHIVTFPAQGTHPAALFPYQSSDAKTQAWFVGTERYSSDTLDPGTESFHCYQVLANL